MDMVFMLREYMDGVFFFLQIPVAPPYPVLATPRFMLEK
jgi:hypothetical protein